LCGISKANNHLHLQINLDTTNVRVCEKKRKENKKKKKIQQQKQQKRTKKEKFGKHKNNRVKHNSNNESDGRFLSFIFYLLTFHPSPARPSLKK
jgi:hypothetical protein